MKLRIPQKAANKAPYFGAVAPSARFTSLPPETSKRAQAIVLYPSVSDLAVARSNSLIALISEFGDALRHATALMTNTALTSARIVTTAPAVAMR